LALSNVGLWQAVERLVEHHFVHAAAGVGRAVVLGGGGYNPWTVIRCWSGLWGRLSGREIPETLPPAAQELLGGLRCDLIEEDEVPETWLTTLADVPNTGPVRPEVARLPGLVLQDPCTARIASPSIANQQHAC
jgi:acetoin utilization protein AcuC